MTGRVCHGNIAGRARGLTARYQVESGNAASIAVAAKVGLRRFLTLRHYLSGAGGAA